MITLPPRCELAGLTELRADLVRALGAGPVTIDCAKLTQIDGAGVQLLCAAAQTAARSGVALTWQAAPAVLVNAATALGLIYDLGLAPPAEV